MGGYHTLFVLAQNGYCSNSKQVEVLVAEPLNIPNAFSPNGDGINDAWEITGLEAYPNTQILVFNRWGAKISEKYKVTDGRIWDGGNYPVGTYYYVIDFGDSTMPSLQGALTITK